MATVAVTRRPMWSFRTVFGSTLEADTTMCGSRCAACVEANAIARRALLPSPLRCRGRAACGSGADLCVALFPLSHLLLRRSFRLCEWRLPGWPGDDERAALRVERVASTRACVSARAGGWRVTEQRSRLAAGAVRGARQSARSESSRARQCGHGVVRYVVCGCRRVARGLATNGRA